MLLLLVACTEGTVTPIEGFDSGSPWQPPIVDDTDDSAVDTDTTTTHHDTDTDTTTTWYETADTDVDDTTTTEPPPWWDCDDLPELPTEDTELDGPRGYHDTYFDDSGHLIGLGTGALMQATYDGDVEVFMPTSETIQGMDRLDDGDMVAVGNAALLRITPDGGQDTIAPLVGGYGVTVGPDGMIYASIGNQIRRVDPDTGDLEDYVTLPTTARVLVFSVDSTRAFISTIGAGNVYVVELDEDLNPMGDATVFAHVDGTYQDGLAIDACDNLYLPDYTMRSFSRVSPEGVVTTFFTGAGGKYGHGVEFGSGIDDWREDAIYLPQPYDGNTVRELVIGVPSGDTVRTWK